MTAPIHALLLGAALALTAQEGVTEGGEAGGWIELVRTQSGHLATPASVNGQAPVAFILDTGASHTAIAEGLAAALGYSPHRRDRDVQSLTEQFITERFSLDSLEALGLTRRDLRAVVIPTPPETELSALGLLGRDFLDGRTVTVNVPQARLTLDGPGPAVRDGAVSPRWGVPFARARVSNLPRGARVLIDTGSARSIVNRSFAARISNQPAELRTRIAGVSGRLHRDRPADSVLIHRLRVGGYCRSRVALLAADLHIFEALGWNDGPAMILGLDLLADAVVHIDYASGAVAVEPAAGVRNTGCIGARADAQLDLAASG